MADVDGDGDLDIFTASHDNDEIAWLENDGNQNFSKHVIDTMADGAYFVSPADIDGDGDMDVFAAIKLGGLIAWYRNDGADGFRTSGYGQGCSRRAHGYRGGYGRRRRRGRAGLPAVNDDTDRLVS